MSKIENQEVVETSEEVVTLDAKVPELSAVEQRALSEYQRYILHKFPQQISRVILFGSKARGEARADSDIDLLIILHRIEPAPVERGFYPLGFTDPVQRELIGVTFDFLVDYNVAISPTVMSEREYTAWSPLLANINKEGIELWSKNN